MKKWHLLLGVILFGLLAAWAAAKQAPTPPPVILSDEQGQRVRLYANSYALLIGISDYTNDWPDLPGVSEDIPAVKAALERHGFQVVQPKRAPADYAEFDRVFREFIRDYGSAVENRLLFYFAGHGKTLKLQDGRDMGYLVAAAAPFAEKDRAGFLDHALDMATIAGYARNIQAKHALFVFDSCFSGSIFENTRGEPEQLAYYKASRPVRQFITSGSKDERVPDRSVFREEFVAALEGDGDVDQDGYVTGGELGNFLDTRVVLRRQDEQHPQYGKMSDFDKGDVVFQLPRRATPMPAPRDEPSDSDYSVEDLKAKAKWNAWLNTQMRPAFEEAAALEQADLDATDKAEAWRRFLKNFAQDHPFSKDDDRMRQHAQERIAYWENDAPPTPKQPTPRPSQEGNTHPTLSEEGNTHPNPSQEGNTELPSSEGPGVGSCWENATPGATCAEPTTGMEFVYVPGGCFQMGSNDYDSEKPVHKVCLKGFWMGKCEVTQAQWQAVMGKNPSYFKGADRPVEQVSWNDAQAFLKELNAAVETHGRASLQFRLPSEAEWEYAARAGTTTPFFFGETISADQANYDGNYTYGKGKKGVYREQTTDVGSFPPNDFGLYDMHGNVWEWVADTWHDNYDGAPTDGSVWGSLGDKKTKMLRGGSWLNVPFSVRSAYRGRYGPVIQFNLVGFRLVFSRTH